MSNFLRLLARLGAGLGFIGAMVVHAAPSDCAAPAPKIAASDPRLVSQYNDAGCAPGLLDPQGVAIIDYGGKIGRQYNPVTIAQWAIGCYYSFRRDKNPDEKKVFLDQINWLKHNWVAVGDNGAAYEYHFPWSYGLKPGWRSGLAQGQTISALIRYYYETDDSSVLPLVKQLKNYMLLPTDRGGLLDLSPEGGIWIEEFPSDPPSFVLNGFISAAFGLYEYTKLFPQNKPAQDVFARIITSIKTSLPYYDTGNWTYLDRNSRPYPRASNGYAIGYIYQAHTLWQITGDPFFLAVSLRWRSFYDNVNYHAGGNMAADPDGRYRLVSDLQPTALSDGLRGNYLLLSATPALDNFGVDQLDRGGNSLDPATYYSTASDGPAKLYFRLKRPVAADALTITLYNSEMYPENLKLFVKSEDDDGLEELPYKMAAGRNLLTYYFMPHKVSELLLVGKRFHGQNRLVIAGLALGTTGRTAEFPEFGSKVTGPVPLGSPEFAVRLQAPAESRGSIFVLYRHAGTLADLDHAPWDWDYLDPFADETRTVKDKLYQFDLLSTKAAGQRGWSRFAVVARGLADVPEKYDIPEGVWVGDGLVGRTFAGAPVTIRLDPRACSEFDLGSIRCGSDYRAGYEPKTNRWKVTGYSLALRADTSAVSDNADKRPGRISIWGVLARFDDAGDLYYSNTKIGKVERAAPLSETICPAPAPAALLGRADADRDQGGRAQAQASEAP